MLLLATEMGKKMVQVLPPFPKHFPSNPYYHYFSNCPHNWLRTVRAAWKSKIPKLKLKSLHMTLNANLLTNIRKLCKLTEQQILTTALGHIIRMDNSKLT